MSTHCSNVRATDLFPASVSSGGRGARSPLATDAIEEIWIAAAAELGFRVSRTRDAYATSDGRGVIAIGADDVLDPDDAVAQLIFHELCHAITEGEQALSVPDWGLENRADHVVREHACLRFAADLSARFGLRGAMAPTTEYRAYYDALAEEPLLPERAGDDEAVAIGTAARARFVASIWRVPIERALAATAALVHQRETDAHPTGFPWGPAAETCDGCAWMYRGGRGPAVSRCRQTAAAVGDGARVEPGTRACARWEPPVDCQACGACCREAYHSVTVSVRDPVVWREPALIVRNGHRFEILREGPRCAALKVADDQAGTLGGFLEPPAATPLGKAQLRQRDQAGTLGGFLEPPAATPLGKAQLRQRDQAGTLGGFLEPPAATPPGKAQLRQRDAATRYSCTIYENRPQPCRDFAANGRHCLDARRRVGLSARAG